MVCLETSVELSHGWEGRNGARTQYRKKGVRRIRLCKNLIHFVIIIIIIIIIIANTIIIITTIIFLFSRLHNVSTSS